MEVIQRGGVIEAVLGWDRGLRVGVGFDEWKFCEFPAYHRAVGCHVRQRLFLPPFCGSKLDDVRKYALHHVVGYSGHAQVTRMAHVR